MINWTALALSDIFNVALLASVLIALLVKIRFPSALRLAGTSLFAAIFAGYLLNEKIIYIVQDKLIQEAYVNIFSIISGIVLLTLLLALYLRSKKQAEPVFGLPVRLFLVFLIAIFFLPKFIQFLKLPQRLVFQASMFNSDVLMQSFGLATGLLIAVIVFRAIVKIGEELKVKWLIAFLAAAMLPGFVFELVDSLRVFVLNSIVSLSPSLTGALIDLINMQDKEKYSYFIIALAILPLAEARRRKYRLAYLNNSLNSAALRKGRSIIGSRFRWMTVLFFAVLSASGVLLADSVLASKTEVLIGPATKVKSSGGLVKIKTAKLKDGELHRFAFVVGGKEVKFLVIYKGSGIYGVALDACQICGPDGFYKKEDNVICAACDSVVNKATVGFPGGCNPLPLEHTVTADYIEIDAKNLEEAAKYFNEEKVVEDVP